jgi:hypothetical protein
MPECEPVETARRRPWRTVTNPQPGSPSNEADAMRVTRAAKTLRRALLPSTTVAMLLPGDAWADNRRAQADEADGMVMRSDSVAARLGGFPGIRGFLKITAPVILHDAIAGPFFDFLAMLLDHDLGGSSPHFGAKLTDGHQCRSSMSDIHRGRHIPDQAVDRFVHRHRRRAGDRGRHRAGRHPGGCQGTRALSRRCAQQVTRPGP